MDTNFRSTTLQVISRAASSELLEGAEARVRKFFSSFLHVLLALKDRNPEEMKASAREWARRYKKKDADADASDKVEKRMKKGKSSVKEDGAKDDEDGKNGEGGKDEDDDEEEDKGEKGDGDDDKMEDEEDERDDEEEEDSDDGQDDLWQSVHSQTPPWLPLRSLRSQPGGPPGEAGAGEGGWQDKGIGDQGGEEDGGIWKLDVKPGVKVFYGNLSCYVFFRLYQKLYQRLLNAKDLAQHVQQEREAERNSMEENADAAMVDSDSTAAVPLYFIIALLLFPLHHCVASSSLAVHLRPTQPADPVCLLRVCLNA
jgi:hypothetical protein